MARHGSAWLHGSLKSWVHSNVLPLRSTPVMLNKHALTSFSFQPPHSCSLSPSPLRSESMVMLNKHALALFSFQPLTLPSSLLLPPPAQWIHGDAQQARPGIVLLPGAHVPALLPVRAGRGHGQGLRAVWRRQAAAFEGRSRLGLVPGERESRGGVKFSLVVKEALHSGCSSSLPSDPSPSRLSPPTGVSMIGV